MSDFLDKTSVGGVREDFQTTHWSEIFNIRTPDEVRQNTVMDSLLRKYWKPVYCYIRHQGYNNEQAKDLTQGFFQEVVLDSNLIRQADPAKGRFRTFLLTALSHYLIDVHRKEKAKKRAPQGQAVLVGTDNLPKLPTAQTNMTPEQVFNYAWATEIIDHVISEVRKECYDTGKEVHWEIFNAKIVIPIMENAPTPRLKELCDRYNVDSEAKASNMITTIKRRFRRMLEGQLRCYVRADSEIEEEFNELLGIIAKTSAG